MHMQITRRVTLWTHALIKNATLNVQRRAKKVNNLPFRPKCDTPKECCCVFYREQQPPPLVTGDVGTIAIAEMDLLIE